MRSRRCSVVLVALVAWTALAGPWGVRPARAQDPSSEDEDLDARSLAFRTALHHDPSLGPPLEQLVSMYRTAGKVDELLGMYRAHVAQYPQDAAARTVLVRLLAATGDADVVRAAQAAAAQFPENAYLRYVLYEVYHKRHDPRALEQLDQAIEREDRPRRKVAWVDRLLPLAVEAGRRDLAEKHLRALASLVEGPDERLEVARRMNEYEFFEPALAVLEAEPPAPPPPETMVSMELEAAVAEVGLGRRAAAGARLDRLLAKLTADYWRRGQIVRRRLGLVDSEAERESLIAAARQRVDENPLDEAAALDLAQVLAGLQRRRDALAVLFEAGQRMPRSAAIERRTLEMLDLLRDVHGREKYLAERIEAQSDRPDLVSLYVRTLYLLGRPEEALGALNGLVDTLAPDERAAHLLETARFLRRSLLTEDAVELFRRVVKLEPSRLDVRRELAETYLATGDRRRLRELFESIPAREASLENVLDLVQFMIEQDLLVEARGVLHARLEEQPEDLDLRAILLSVERRLGHSRAGEELIAESRALADTAARYRQWLESAVVFHEEFDTVEAFLEAEQGRLDEEPGEWTANRLERRLAFAEIAARSGRRQETAAMLESDLAGELPGDFRIRLRRQLVAILEDEPGESVAVEEELARLAEEDSEHADQYRARLAHLHAKKERHDLVAALVEKIDVAKIQDTAVLSALRPLLARHPQGRRQVVRALERLTELNPTDRNAWEQWLTALATSGDERRLRTAIQKLLAGVEKMPLSEETRRLLEAHLSDSYWRDVGRCLADDRDDALSEALICLDAVEPAARSDQQWLWITWIRAYLLDRLGRDAARDEAIAELGRVAERLTGSWEEGEERKPRIAFPDGITISLERARKMLTAAVPRPVPRPGPQQGPSPRFRVKWAYETRSQTVVSAVVPLTEKRTLICDSAGTGHCIEAATGRLLWRREVLPAAMLMAGGARHSHFNLQQQLQQIQQSQQSLAHMPAAQRAAAAQQLQRTRQMLLAQLALPSTPVSDGQGRFYVPGPGEVACHAVEDGRVLWRADVGAVAGAPPATGNTPAPAPASLLLEGEHLLSYDPSSGTLTRIDPATGKIVWEQTYAPPVTPAAATWYNSGADLHGDRLLIFGPRTAIVDLTSGEEEWSFEPWRVRKFPLKLRDSPAPTSTPRFTSGATPGSQYATVRSPYRPNPPAGQSVQFLNYLQMGSAAQSAPFTPPPGEVSLAAPAVAWASQRRQGQAGRAGLLARWLLLFDSSGVQIIPTDLPLAGKRVSANGQVVGISGRVVCLLDGNVLRFVDVGKGTAKEFGLAEIATGPAITPIQAVIDGPRVYAVGPGGILCINALTAGRAFRADWPDELLDAASSGSAAPVTSASPGGSSVYPSGYSMPVLGGMGYSSGYGQPSYYAGRYAPGRFPGVSGLHAPRISHVARGVLYTTVSPHRVVALAEQEVDAR